MNNIRKIIEERLENARNDYENNLDEHCLEEEKFSKLYTLQGQIDAYQDCLNLIPASRTEQEILKDFEKLEQENQELRKNVKEIENLYLAENKHWCETTDSLRKENEKLKKALDEACKMLNWDCPCGQNLIDDLDCENRCTPDIDYSVCWKKYFLKKVLGNV